MKQPACVIVFVLWTALPLAARAAVPDGYVVRVESATVYLDWGKTSTVKLGDRFKIYRPGTPLKHPMTGEMLGHTEIAVADGSIDGIEEKFSRGRLFQASLPPQAGDRTHYAELLSSVAAAGLVSEPAESSATAQLPYLKEAWHSESLPQEAIGLALGDLEGDGHPELVVASKEEIEVYRVVDKHLALQARYKGRGYKHWLGVETADPSHQGHDDIFATVWQDSYQRPRIVVLRFEKGALRPIADFAGFVRAGDAPDGSQPLVWQDLSRSREKAFTPPAVLTASGTVFMPREALSIPGWRDDQLFGFSRGNWTGGKSDDLATLESGDTLRVRVNGKSMPVPGQYGGTKNEFITGDTDETESFTPRLRLWRPAQGPAQLIVPHNILEFGIRFMHVRLYKKSEISGLVWNGTQMAPAWTQPISGYLADFAIGDGIGASSPQLWLAVVDSDKTSLIAYRLP